MPDEPRPLPEADTVDASAATPASATPSGSTSPTARGTVAVGPGTVLGRYEIVDELGAGGMATVFRARDPQLRRDVAVKVMFPHLAKKPDVARRFQREARAAAGLEHPNILRVYDVGGGRAGDLDEPPHIVMELVRGRTLRDVVDETGPVLPEVVACAGAVLCEALGVAHRAGVVHRDVKPGNVMVGDDGRLLLADFGVARLEGDDSLVTKTGALLGTPSFMSPEQATGSDVDARSDLYSLGATLYQLATGSVPFSGPTAMVVAAIAKGEYTPALRRRPQIGADLSRAIGRLMAKDPAQRPATAEAAAAMLRDVAKAGGFGEPREEVAAWLRDPAGFTAAREPAVVARLVAQAKEAIAARALPRAMAQLDRVLAMQPEHAEARELAARIAPRSRTAVFAVAGVVAAALAGAGVYAMTREPAGVEVAADAGAEAAAVADAAAAAGADAAAAAAAAAGADAAAAAAAAAAADAGSGTGTGTGPRGRRRRVDAGVPIDAGVPPDARMIPIDARPAPATISVQLDAWCDLAIDGADLGRLDRKKKYTVDPGRHRVSCSQGPGMSAWSDVVDLRSGEHRVVRGSLLGEVKVTIRVSGDQVRVGGTAHANGKSVALRPGRVRVEVLEGGEVVTSGWVSIPRVAACTLTDRPDLDCTP